MDYVHCEYMNKLTPKVVAAATFFNVNLYLQ